MERRWHAGDGGRRSPHQVRGYLKHALAERGPKRDGASIEAAVREGALLRVRPKVMTVAVILAGLLPILLGTGTGSEVMRPDRRGNDRRHADGPTAVDARNLGRLPADAPANRHC